MRYFLNDCSKLLCCDCSVFWWCSEFNLSHHSDYICQRFSKVFVWWIILRHLRFQLNRRASMVIARYKYQPLTKTIFSRPKICVNILNIFWGRIKTTKISVLNELKYLNLSCLVRDRGVWSPLCCIGVLLSHNTRLVECGIVRMGVPVSDTITVSLRPMSQWITPS